MKPKIFLGVFLIFIFAYFLRILFLSQNALTFGYDQARDALVTQQIIAGDLKILGPSASTPGLYHGAFYNYVLVPAYLFGKNPINAAYWIAFLNAAVVFVVFYLTYLMTKKVGAALLASILFAVSFETTQYAVWLSNPTIGVWTVALAYLGLWAWVKERKSWGPVLTGLGLGLSIQAEVFLLYHAIPILLWIFITRNKIARGEVFRFLTFGFLAVLTMVIAELKFGFRSIGGVLHLLSSQDALVASRGFGDFIVLYLNQLGKVFSYSTYPGNIGYGGVFVLILIVFSFLTWQKKDLSPNGYVSWQPFLITWLLSHITVVSLGGTSTPFLLVGIGTAVSIFVGIHVFNWWSSGKKLLAGIVLTIMVLGNLMMIFRENIKGQTIFAIQKDMLLSKQMQVIDYTYTQANGESFSVNTLTSPLWINIVWAYLYDWYGREKYGYVSEFHGRNQIGQLLSLPETSGTTKLYFLIIEPMAGIPRRYLGETISEEDTKSELIEEKSFGELVVQKRMRKDIK